MAPDNDVVTVGLMKNMLEKFYMQKLFYIKEILQQNIEFKKIVANLEDKVDKLGAYSRRNNVIVCGIPEKENENPVDLAIEISIKIVKIERNEIDAARRLPTKNKNTIMPLLNYGGYGKRNDRGECMVNFCHQNNLKILNKFIKKRAGKMWIWLSPNQETKNQIDFILTKQSRRLFLDCTTTKFGIPSDHKLIKTKLLIKNFREIKKNYTKKRR